MLPTSKVKSVIVIAALAVFTAGAAVAQTPTPAPAPASTAPAPAAAAGKLSVTTTPISEIVKNPKAKAIIETAMPGISQYYDQIGGMTLTEIIPASGGAVTQAQVDAVQAEFDKIN